MKWSERLKSEREKANLTQAQLAEKLGTTYQNISQYERGVRKPRYDNMVRIAAAIGVPVNVIWPGDEMTDDETASHWNDAVMKSHNLNEAYNNQALALLGCMTSTEEKRKALIALAEIVDSGNWQRTHKEESQVSRINQWLTDLTA